ncbi:MAG: sigma-70 family RNA polymerase sigma factor [Bacteroidales bacterium]|nr:sigma-70 family RNA polymerase sigma factor [Bacteroidales bacterium]
MTIRFLNNSKRKSHPESKKTDEELIIIYQKTLDLNILAELFGLYVHLVYGIAIKYLKDEELSKDAVMDIYEILIEKLKKHNVTSFKSWLYTVVKNYCLMYIRSKEARRKISSQVDRNFLIEFMEFEEEMHPDNEQMNYLELLEEAIGSLNREQGECIKLFYFEDKSYKEISVLTGHTLIKVKSHIQNGKRNLKNYLTSSDGKYTL